MAMRKLTIEELFHPSTLKLIDWRREHLEGWGQLRLKSVKSSSTYDERFAVV
jgi:hypothetical protein